MDIPAHIASFWQAFVQSRAEDPTPRFFEAFHFDDNESSADELADLVMSGAKCATAGLVWVFERDAKPLPKASDLSVVTNWAGMPLCVIETRRVDIVPYEDVSEEFAATEGEGDGSLRYWRKAHWAYFGRECKRIGRTPELRMPVTCERFAVVYRGGDEVS
jgi:uncharacterized protein YhfF